MAGPDSVAVRAGAVTDRKPETPELARAARQFEGLLLQQMLRFAETPISGESLLDGGSAGRMYRSLFYEHVAEISSRRGGLGIADLLLQQLGERQENQGLDEENP